MNKDIKQTTEESINFIYLIGVLFRYWKFIFAVCFFVGVFSIIYVLVVPPVYQSSVTMYPITKDQGGPLKDLAVSLGMASKSDGFYLHEVLKSRRISKKIIYNKYEIEGQKDSLNLIQFFGLNEMDISENRKFEATLKAIKNSITISDDKETGLVQITIMLKDKKLCKDIAEYYTVAVTDYLQNEQKNQVKF